MSDFIKHECGVAFIRLLKPPTYYLEKYGNATYALNKLYLLMEKQHNRGQDGAGIASVKLNVQAGVNYIDRYRSDQEQPIKKVFDHVFDPIRSIAHTDQHRLKDADWMKQNLSFYGELLLGHLRYGTHGKNDFSMCHPRRRLNNWKARNLLVAGNFNLTNVDELFDQLIELGQHPKEMSDTVTVMEKIGHFLDTEVQQIFDKYKDQNYQNYEITPFICKELNIARILKRSTKNFDGGYVMAGIMGHGDAFVMRDPHGIRPAYYYADDELVVVASERPSILTAFNVPFNKVEELPAGAAITVKFDGTTRIEQILKAKRKVSCSFERIYFSRGTDAEIYEERKKLGYLLSDQVLNAVKHDFEHSIFSFIPNTAEVAFYGLVKGVEEKLRLHQKKEIAENNLSDAQIDKLLSLKARVEKIAVKDVKMRTFITADQARDELVSHVYDITYGTVEANVDNLVMIDDSIVRGTTLERSILSIISRLNPKKIIIVSSAPQIRYPDCYGIDMSKLGEFIAFRAAIALLEETGQQHIKDEVYQLCKKAVLDKKQKENYVKRIYAPFTDDEISTKISEIVKPSHIFSDVEVIYQQVENLHKACPKNLGDWYFTGDFPTPGGIKVVNQSFVNYYEGKNKRAY